MDKQPEPAFWPWLISLGGGAALVGYFAYLQDHITAIVCITIGLSAMAGYSLMASRIVCLNSGLILAGAATWALVWLGLPTMLAWLGTSGTVLLLGLTGAILTAGATLKLRRLVAEHTVARPKLDWCNRWLGFGLGAVQGACLCGLVLAGFLVFEPIAADRVAADGHARDHKIAHIIATNLIDYAGKTRTSSIGTTVARHGLMRHIEPLHRYRDQLRDFANPLTREPSAGERAAEDQFTSR